MKRIGQHGREKERMFELEIGNRKMKDRPVW